MFLARILSQLNIVGGLLDHLFVAKRIVILTYRGNEDDPSTYCHVMEDSNKEKCQKPMNQEMKSMYSNSVYELVNSLEDVKPRI